MFSFTHVDDNIPLKPVNTSPAFEPSHKSTISLSLTNMGFFASVFSAYFEGIPVLK